MSVLAVFSRGRRGTRALWCAAAIASEHDLPLTVVALAPHPPPSVCHGVSPRALEEAIREAAAGDLELARELLGERAAATRFMLLEGGCDPPLERWAAQSGFSWVVLPRGTLGLANHRPARRLHAAGAEVRLV